MSLKDKITGRFKKAAGDLADDESLHREGRREERKGEAKEELADAHAKTDAKAEEVPNLGRKPPCGGPPSRGRPRPPAGRSRASCPPPSRPPPVARRATPT